MTREITLFELLVMVLAVVAGGATFGCAMITLFHGQDGVSAVFAVGGLGLAVWTGARLS